MTSTGSGNANNRAEVIGEVANTDFISTTTELRRREIKKTRFQFAYAVALLYVAINFATWAIFGSFSKLGILSYLTLPVMPLAAFVLLFGPVSCFNGWQRGKRAEIVAAVFPTAFWLSVFLMVVANLLKGPALNFASQAVQIICAVSAFVSSIASIKVIIDHRKESLRGKIKRLGCNEQHT